MKTKQDEFLKIKSRNIFRVIDDILGEVPKGHQAELILAGFAAALLSKYFMHCSASRYGCAEEHFASLAHSLKLILGEPDTDWKIRIQKIMKGENS